MTRAEGVEKAAAALYYAEAGLDPAKLTKREREDGFEWPVPAAEHWRLRARQTVTASGASFADDPDPVRNALVEALRNARADVLNANWLSAPVLESACRHIDGALALAAVKP